MSLCFTPDDVDGDVDVALKEWATPRQAEFIDATNLHGSMNSAERALGITSGVICKSLKRLRARAAASGYSPAHGLNSTIAPGYVGKGHSTLEKINPDGSRTAVLQWTKTKADDLLREELQRAAYEAMASELPRVAASSGPGTTSDALCNVYTLTDSHIGMLAWRKEGGADWDLNIAEQVLTGCFERMVAASPASAMCVVNQLGDWLHSDGLLPVTPTSGHILDQDGRFSKMVSAAIRILRRMVDFALARHDRVVLVVAEGNHDLAGSVWLRLMFQALYENEPRVSVVDSELPYYCVVHGETMLAFHHGHMKKNDQLPLLFASQYPREWGATTKRYAHVGHRHHEEIKEHSGMKVTQHATLAARDAYAARGGWHAERNCTSYTYHARWGQVGSVTISPEMLEAA